MSTVEKHPGRRMRLWPGVIFPVGLTFLLGLAAWQFSVGVRAEAERLEADAIRLEGYARMEAGELSSRARTLAHALVDSRLENSREQEQSLRLEVRGVMEAVNRVLTATLDRSRIQAASRREVGHFPSGFEGVGKYLEIARTPSGTDQALTALRACAPELAALLPSGCSLSVVENNAAELLSLGGGSHPENAVSVAMSREFAWDDGGESRRWTLHVRSAVPNAHPLPDAEELALHLGREMGFIRLDRVNWRGWLVGADGQPAGVFPATGAAGGNADDMPHFTNMPEEWVEIDARQLVWLERPVRMAERELTPVVAVSIASPPKPPELMGELLHNRRWTFTLGALALFSLGMWVWFVRSLWTRSGVPEREARAAAVRRPRRETGAVRQRLVRDGTRVRAVPEVEGVIVADLDAEGGMRVAALDAYADAVPVQVRPVALPSGSLFRLQERHRGGKGRPGNRALDRARSPVLKELAARVRPVVPASASAFGEVRDDMMRNNPLEGWDKVEE